MNARRILVAIGTTCYWLEDETWQKAVLTPAHSPITAVLVVPETDLQLAAAPERLYLKQGSGEWQDYSHGLDGETIVDLRPSINFSEDSKLLGLTLDGRLYSREV